MLRDLTAKTCLLSSDNNPHRVMAIKLADESLTHGANPNNLRWLQLTKVLADYRASRLNGYCASTGQYERRGVSPGDAIALLIQAMAEHRLVRVEEAQDDLKRAREIMKTKMPNIGPQGLDRGWHHGLRARIICREAESLIEASQENQPK